MSFYRSSPLTEDALKEIWKHHAADVEATRVPGSPGFNRAQIDRRVLLHEVQRLLDQIARMDADLIEAQGRLQDLT